jgi:hypothetical protein
MSRTLRPMFRWLSRTTSFAVGSFLKSLQQASKVAHLQCRENAKSGGDEEARRAPPSVLRMAALLITRAWSAMAPLPAPSQCAHCLAVRAPLEGAGLAAKPRQVSLAGKVGVCLY